ncbi:MAG TPA: Trp family transcriptional regulator [Vitreimonas sp.]|nr:Trp family transcriptional regulator [Vitreimonas sp.]
MQTSSHALPAKHHQQLLNRLYTLLADLKHPNDVQAFLADFLTDTERLVFAKRLGILWELQQGKSYEEIKKALQVSSATISSVAEVKGKKGWQLALEKMTADQWAERTLRKLPFFKK